MKILQWMGSLFRDSADSVSAMPLDFAGEEGDLVAISTLDVTDINPASGLPMIDGIGGVDVAGNPYGSDLSEDALVSSSSMAFDDDWSSGSSSGSHW